MRTTSIVAAACCMLFVQQASAQPQERQRERVHRDDKDKRDDRGDKDKRDHRGDRGRDATPATGHGPPPPRQGFAVGEPHPRAPGARQERKERKRWSQYQIPVVTSYWPDKGDVGTTVTIHGANFNPGLRVFLGATEISGITFTPTSITFKIPRGATDGFITVRGAGNRRALAVGRFEVTKFDAMGAWKKRDKRHRKDAEDRWRQRKGKMGKDRPARFEALQRREAEMAASRAERRARRHQEIRARFEAAFLADPDTQAELTLHAERMARLERMVRLAEANYDDKLVIRVDIAIARENERHDSRMAALKAAFMTPPPPPPGPR